jgi:hypothetical protein
MRPGKLTIVPKTMGLKHTESMDIRVPGIHDLAASFSGQEPKVDKMHTGPQQCYKQVGKELKALDITKHEVEYVKQPFCI